MDIDRLYFASGTQRHDQFGRVCPGNQSVFVCFCADESEAFAEQLREVEAIQVVVTLLLTVSTQLGVGFNARHIESATKYVVPELR